ncbi:PTS sugar transporter subunit IIA [Clostridium fungisolvens]|uniref:PTS system glucose-specific EIIA component n=1 Tax=Clostridium fungisolvens TaxID=1604897 RepID=A0A6V8SC74_9CLOT|nr:PTS glucose transporter subunit IIA [Clostridium fungisolvens]GFP74065.1 PTS system glucose-specific EIIA component [Clostridium fungisolvens]
MLDFFKKTSSNCVIKAPVSGKCVALEDLKDGVFSEKMLGDGVAIDTTGDVVCAPCDGVITTVVPSKHAFAMKLKNGLEILVHIGLETVSLNGEGFTILAEVDKKVKVGTPIIKIDRAFIESKGISLITPVIIVGEQQCDLNKCAIGEQVTTAESSIIECKII